MRLIAVLGLATVVTACGTEREDTAPNEPQVGTEASPTTVPGADDVGQVAEVDDPTGTSTVEPDVPVVDVVSLADGSTVDLRSLATPGKPTLLWFWAPHCSFCVREAPELLAFDRDHGADVDILGVGAQDSLNEAYEFLDSTATSDLAMVWDASGRSWVHYGVTNQPTVILLGADGQVAETWFRDFVPGEILAAAGLA